MTSQNAISSSVVWNSALGGLSKFNFFLQNRGNQVFGACLGKQTFRLLALLQTEIIGVLATISVSVFASELCYRQNDKYNEF